MAITASDVVSENAVRAILEEQTRKTYQYRRAFRDHDATGISDGSLDFPVPDNDLDGEAVEIGEGADYPRAGTSDSTVKAVYKKYGLEVPITDEAVSDSMIDIEMNNQANMIWAEESRFDSLAFNALDANLNSSGPVGDDGGNLTQAEISTGKTTLFDDEYDVQEMIVLIESDGWDSLVTSDGLTPASDMGDFVLETGLLPSGDIGPGFVGVTAGLPVFVTNTADAASNDAYIVDTSQYGYESTRWTEEISSYREEDNDQTVFKIRRRADFIVTDSAAAIKVQG